MIARVPRIENQVNELYEAFHKKILKFIASLKQWILSIEE